MDGCGSWIITRRKLFTFIYLLRISRKERKNNLQIDCRKGWLSSHRTLRKMNHSSVKMKFNFRSRFFTVSYSHSSMDNHFTVRNKENRLRNYQCPDSSNALILWVLWFLDWCVCFSVLSTVFLQCSDSSSDLILSVHWFFECSDYTSALIHQNLLLLECSYSSSTLIPQVHWSIKFSYSSSAVIPRVIWFLERSDSFCVTIIRLSQFSECYNCQTLMIFKFLSDS